MKKIVTLSLAVLAVIVTSMFLLSNRASSIAADGSWYVSSAGSDQNACNTPATPCASIDEAIDKANADDTLYVAAGSYSGDKESIVTINKNINLSGGWDATFSSQKAYSVIEGSGVDINVTGAGISVSEDITATIERMIIQNFRGKSTVYGPNSGLYNHGSITLNNCIIRNNAARDSGGGILNGGMMTITNSTVSNNYASYGGGGIYNSGFSARLVLVDSTISGNQSGLDGAGIFNHGVMTITHSTIRDNETTFHVGSDSFAGGIYNLYGTIYLVDSLIENNRANASGGGIYDQYGSLHVWNSVIRNNSAADGGGGIYSDSSTAEITNSTISNNEAGGSGGGIYNDNTTLYINSSTVSHNQAGSAGGLLSGGALYNAGTSILQNTILAENLANQAPDCSGNVDSQSYNLFGHTAGCTISASSSDLLNIDPQIGHLVDILGYNPLAPSSPAIDAGNPAGCTDNFGSLLSTDQRGASRNGRCDIGAYEYLPPGPPASLLSVSGTPQSTAVMTTFSELFSAIILDENGSPVNGYSLTFAAPTDGASGTFLDSGTYSTTAITDDWGLGTAASFEANGEPGVYSVYAIAGNSGSFTTFSLTNITSVYMPGVTCRYCSDFFDEFSNPYTGWYTGDDEFSTSGYFEGEYRIITKEPDYLYLVAAPTCLRQNYTVESDAHWYAKTGSIYGIVFAIQGDFDSFFLFYLNSEDQSYGIYYYQTGHTLVSLVYPTDSPAIHSGTQKNHLKITLIGTNVTAEVNGTVLGNWQWDRISGSTSVGVAVGSSRIKPKSDARFDNFAVYVLPATATLINERDPEPSVSDPDMMQPLLYHLLTTELNLK